ncbi:MAG: chromosome segregation protein SMC [Planctomycetota bacterium]|jgi:chromosome segregation protein|nr:chromosome segregation protein SMC [Planctomycetota bacterium]
MRLHRLELLGFKSFADRTVFEFGDDTQTGVVGPHGCGKSNVVDALRWVLGEQRPTSMRGKEMTDVIFKGCASRPALGVAEATVVLDNAGRMLPDCGEEVQITRRVFQSGEGEYLIDGRRVRLKDVRELLFDTGLGSRGYSVLEQGRIDAVLSANPVDRRRIFEEAAGISRYRQRKHETELRLARVHQDLARLDDVTGELRTRVRSLKIQAGRAERFVAAKEEWQREKARLLRHRLHSLERSLTECVDDIRAREERLASLRKGREELEGELGLRRGERSTLAAELERVTADVTRLEGDGRAMDERKRQLDLRIAGLERTSRAEEERAAVLAAGLEARGRDLEELQRSREDLAGGAEGAREEVLERSGERKRVDRATRELRARSEEQNTVVLRHLHEKTEAANTLHHLEQGRSGVEERGERVEARLCGVREEVAAAREEAQSRADDFARAEAELVRREALREESAARTTALASALEESAEALRELELDVARRSSAIESLLDRDRERADLGVGSRRLLEAAEEGTLDCPAAELSGLVADHLRCGTDLARALDVVLGERARALVIGNARTARSLAQWLRSGDGGQAALCVPELLGEPTPAPAELDPATAALTRCVLADELEVDEGFESLARALTGDVLVVEELATALEVVRAAPGRRCVTPAGELVDAAGVIAGERTLAQGPVGRRSSAADLQEELAAVEDRRRQAEGERDRQRAGVEEAREAEARQESGLEEQREALAGARGAAATAAARAEDRGAALETLERESAEVLTERERLHEALVAAEVRRQETVAEFERENSILETLEVERRRQEEARDDLGRREGRSQVELTRIEEQLGGLDRRIDDLGAVRAENEAELERARRLAIEAADGAVAARAEREQLAREAAASLNERARADERLRGLREHAGEGDRILDALRGRRDESAAEHERESSALTEVRLTEQRATLAREEVLRRAEEELELDGAGLLEGFQPEEELAGDTALDGLERKVAELRGGLDRLGPVNMDALGELEEVGGRLEFLEEQTADLARSRKVLDETLRKIERESERLFVETFEEVRGNFRRIFRQLFGGGRADVTLQEGVGVLDAGVEIVARPPGRELLPIGLLSGGQRSMTALALLFAVFEARPSPFCVLDEVDAALDDANIQRFLAMLETFRRSTQFVLVTHNKGSMTACESLYGVTMATKGVSRQVRVELDEVDEIVPDASGAQRANARGEIDVESGEPVKELTPAGVSAAPGDRHEASASEREALDPR